jgi:hypothetical protein
MTATEPRSPREGDSWAHEAGNMAATLLILRATELMTPGRGTQMQGPSFARMARPNWPGPTNANSD